MTGNLTDYTNRVTSEHKNKPNFMASLTASLQPLIDQQYLCNNLYSYFDIQEAVGAQLDIIGLWLGIKRQLSIPLTNVFFTWDTIGLGWDQAVWFGPFDPTSGQASMDDATYRAVLQMRAALNGWNGSRGSLGNLITNTFENLFPGLTIVLVDNFNMSIDFRLYGNVEYGNFGVGGLTPTIQQLFLQGFFTVKPCGVLANYKIWNGTELVTSAFNYGIELNAPSEYSSIPPITSVEISGQVMPSGDAQSIRLQVSDSSTEPPAGFGESSAGSGQAPPSAGAYWYNPTTYDNTAGTFSIDLPVDITTPGMYYIWAYDPTTRILQCSNVIVVT